jgi:hypothetical protein
MSQDQVFPLERSMAPTVTAPRADSAIRRIWPSLVIALGLALTFAWVGLMAYGLFILLENSF